jgi:PhzF family phenazine biosynthesis protein
VDVFGGSTSSNFYKGNPLAVVVDSEGISDSAMQAFARWTNLSETTFLLPPLNTNQGGDKTGEDQVPADYRVRIFTPY